MELTRETIELLADGSIALDYGDTKIMAKQLLSEMDKQKVWDGAPEWASTAMAVWYGKDGQVAHSKDYTREPPKSRIDEIAEEVGKENAEKYGWNDVARNCMIEAVKSAILKDREERALLNVGKGE